MLNQIRTAVHRAVSTSRASAELRTLEHAGDQESRVARAVHFAHGRGAPPLDRIEAWRRDTESSDRPLVDGSLGPAGPFDLHPLPTVVRASKGPLAARFLYGLVREFKPLSVLELGTNVGISSAYLGAALAANGAGRLVTLESSLYRLRVARELHDLIGAQNIERRQGLFADTLRQAAIDARPVDMAFIDGHHQFQPTLDYFDEIARHASPQCVFVFDDIEWSDGMKAAWSKLREDDRFGSIVGLGTVGVAILGKGPARYAGPFRHIL